MTSESLEFNIQSHVQSVKASSYCCITVPHKNQENLSMDIRSAKEEIRHINLSRGQRMNRIMLSLRKSLADLGDSSRLLTKPKNKLAVMKGNAEGELKTTNTVNVTTDIEMMKDDLSSPDPYNTQKDMQVVSFTRLGLTSKSSSRRVLPCPLTYKLDQPVTVHDRYAIKKQIGVGGFSKVFKATHRMSGRKFAIKRIQMSLLSGKDKQNIKSEVAILRSLKSESIISVHDVFQTDAEYVYLVMERVKGGELYNRIVENGTFSEPNARLICKSILRAVKYCHDRGVVHRDLKPENILLVAKNSSDIKICDFGCAGRLKQGEYLHTFCGTINYMAPEMVKRRLYNESVDMWSLGVILFVAIAGYHPFEGDNNDQIRKLIVGGSYNLTGPEWFGISPICKELISAMMELDPNARISADMALLHPWSSFHHQPFVI